MQLANLPDTDSDLETTDHLTKDMLIGSLPDKRFRKHVTDDVVDLVNSEPNSELRRVFRDNILSYASALTTGKYSVAAYVNAVKFVSLKLMGDKSSTAYSKVFPDRYQNLVDKGTSASQIASFADNYGKNALITKIMEQTLVPTHILNAGVYQEAINVQADLMQNAKSEMVRQKAAESLITNLKAPDIAKVEIDVNYSNDVIDDLRATTKALAKQQLQMILNGQASAKEVAHSDIIAKKVEPVETEYSVIDNG
jgi:hypothetical protein|tara:strand:- start:147 stop:905 length:759 start_codon:yes stop_codon:yes gene_type:complete